MNYAVASNQFMVAVDGNPVQITTDPMPVGNSNYANVMVNVHALFAGAGAPALSLGWVVEGSNDGQTFTDLNPALGDTLTAAGTPVPTVGPITVAFIRVKFTLSVNGSAGDWGVAAFDMHLKLMFN